MKRTRGIMHSGLHVQKHMKYQILKISIQVRDYILLNIHLEKVFEPIKQGKNVFLERPVYEHKDNSFGIIRYDFNEEVIQVLIF